jgi:hypothetical protein
MTGLISSAMQGWTSFYSSHAAVRTCVGFVHVAGLVSGGGAAISADRATLLAARLDGAARAAQLTAVRNTHRVVVAGLAAVIASGLLLFAADVETYATSVIFWTKMALVGLLLANGWLIVRAERLAGADAASWRALRRGALVSLLLWFLTTLAGAALPNIG